MTRRWVATVLLVGAACGAGSLGMPLSAATSQLAGLGGGNGPCPGPSEASHFTGQLSLDGGPLPGSVVGGVNVSYSYWQESLVSLLSNGTVLAENCALENGTTTTQASGAFAFSISPPGENCSLDPPYGEACTNYTAPYGPVAAAVASPNPAGYGLSIGLSGSFFSLTWVAGLASVTVTPTGAPVVVSTLAPTPVVATPWTANGTVSPLAPTFVWSLNGSGWSFVTPPGTAGSVTVVAAPGAGPGNLTVGASASVGSNSFTTPVLTVALESVPTGLTAGAVNLTAVDVGGPLGVAVTATGAVGYPYSATVTPGLGLGTVTVPCASNPESPSTLTVSCSATVSYPGPGTSALLVNVSNGFSSADWTSPNVTVDPASVLELSPQDPIGYAGTPIPITLAVAAGTGVAPYSMACLDAVGVGRACVSAPGPSWTFRPTFQSPSNYSATAWVVDATGANRSVSLTVRVLGPLSVEAITPSSGNVSAGTSVALSSSLAGGVLPATVWWNSSNGATPLATYSIDADGPTEVDYVPPLVGTVGISLTVRDALGTVVETNRTLTVVVGPATSVAVIRGAPSIPIVVGTPVSLAWQALGAADEQVAGFADPAMLSVAGPSGALVLAWANVSSTDPLSAAPESSFVVPSAAWVGGGLNVTLTPLSAGALTVTLGGPGIPGATAELSLTAIADKTHLHLYDPTVALPGERTNDTLWRVTDRFGNPVPGAYLFVQYLLPGTTVDRAVVVERTPGGGTGAWVNYTIPASGGTVRVLDSAGDLLLPPIRWTELSAPARPGLVPVVLAPAAAIALAVMLASATGRRRRRRAPVPDVDSAARELAEGRAALVEIVRTVGPVRWEAIEDAWDPPPAPPELGEWLASLVADGTLLARTASDGTTEYRLAPPPPEPPQVTMDPAALDLALARREAVVHDEAQDEDRT